MINASTLSAKLTGLIGFRNPTNPKYQIIDAANQASRSGLFVTDNPFVKIETIKDTQDYVDITDGQFNDFLRNKVAASTINVANAVFSEADYIDRQVLYKYALNKFSQTPTAHTDAAGRYVRVLDVQPGFNCYWMLVKGKKNIAFKISRVFLEFNGTGNITLYLYNTADTTTPLQSKTINITGPLQEVVLDWVCDNTGAGYKGDYYLGYFKDECDPSLRPFERLYRAGMVLSTIDQLTIYRYAFGNFTDPTKTFDLTSFTPYNFYNGVNPDITVYEDYTDMIIQNEKLFARAIQIDAQIAFISEYIATIRSNRNERLAAQMAVQIAGESGEGNVKVKGLANELKGTIGSIKKELEKLKTGYTDQGLIRIETIS